jgi:pyruvate/2-oxoglutarate dehydrogenase complex dihydrolipoamide acyltransferase (E2) component
MEHTVPAPHDGIVTEIGVRPGQTVDTGTVLAVVEEAGAEEGGAREAQEAAPGEAR